MKESTSLEKKHSGINLTPENIEEIESLAENNYTGKLKHTNLFDIV